MKISWNWLNQLIDLKNIDKNELANKLTLAGLEIENIIHKKSKSTNDSIFDVNITANRPDINNMASLALEIATIFKIDLKLYNNQDLNNKSIIYKTINFQKNLTEYKNLYFSFTKDICIQDSPTWIQNHLNASEISITNSILDLINFINFKWGQSIEIFDIGHKNIINHSANWNALKKSGIQLNSNNITIYHKTDSNIMIIGYTNKKHNTSYIQKNDSVTSKKHLEYAFLDLTNLIQVQYKKHDALQIIYKYNEITIPTHIICRISHINKILGPLRTNKTINYLDKKTIINILERLRFTVTDFKYMLKIGIPEERQNDIKEEIDIIEEIARVHGFHNFTDNLPILHKLGQLSSIALTTQKIRQILRSMGLHEVITYSLSTNSISSKIQLINPLTQDQKKLRNNLTENLIASKIYNITKTNEDFEVFEIGTTFTYNQDFEEYYEKPSLGIILGNSSFSRFKWNESPNELSWFQAKGSIEELFERMNIKFIWSTQLVQNLKIKDISRYTHPTRTIYIEYKDKTIGIFGQINNKIAGKFHASYKIYIFEIDITGIIKSNKETKCLNYYYKPYSNYPKIIRDISIQIDSHIKIKQVISIINKIQKEEKKLIESINIFDEYYQKNKTKTIGLRTIYRSIDTTLTTTQIEQIEKTFKTRLYSELTKSKS